MLKGDWDRVRRKISQISSTLKTEGDKATSESLALIERTVLRHLDRQDLDWPPLSRQYARYKARTRNPKWRRKRLKAGKTNPRSLSEKMLIATGTYRQAITSHKISAFSGEVGVSRQETNDAGDIVANIGAVHEEGSKDGRIPRRELWGPSADEIANKVRRKYELVIKKLIDV